MKVIRPQFREGIEWRRLTKEERRGKPWKYVLLKDMFIEVLTGVKDHYDCICDGRIWVKILPKGIWMSKDYAWNGNTGAPDTLFWILILLLASLPHDGLFQFSGAEGFPVSIITLTWCNLLYFALSPAWTGWIYLTGLAVFSRAFWRKPPANGETVVCKPLHQPEPV